MQQFFLVHKENFQMHLWQKKKLHKTAFELRLKSLSEFISEISQVYCFLLPKMQCFKSYRDFYASHNQLDPSKDTEGGARYESQRWLLQGAHIEKHQEKNTMHNNNKNNYYSALCQEENLQRNETRANSKVVIGKTGREG